jgi:glycosyltransferase involved in cell wall biosynthesis
MFPLFLYNKNTLKRKIKIKEIIELIILHITSVNFNNFSGLVPAILSSVSYQNNLNGVNVGLLNLLPQKLDEKLDFPYFNEKITDIKDLPKPFNRPDLVIFHSTYIPLQASIAKNLRENNIKYIIVPHGGMTEASLNKKKFKKIIGNLLFYNKYVLGAAGLQYLTKGEANNSTKWKKEYFIVPNGINLPDKSKVWDPIKSTKIKLLFIGRIAPYHKGLDLFINACASIKAELTNAKVQVDIYGPDFEGGHKMIQDLILYHDLKDIININGPILGEEKKNAFLEADIFFHTSRFEGHPMSVLEALSYGLPCIVTPGTNMHEEIQSANAGWVAKENVNNIAEVILKAIRDQEKFNEIGNSSKILARKYDNSVIAQNALRNYKAISSSTR